MSIEISIPVTIYKNNILLKEFTSIQKAAHFMKEELGRSRIPWTIINGGIHENKTYTHINGDVYRFISEKLIRKQASHERERAERDSVNKQKQKILVHDDRVQHQQAINESKELVAAVDRIEQNHAANSQKLQENIVSINERNKHENARVNNFSRKEFIQFLSRHLEEIIHLKLQITDDRLRRYQMSAKGLGDDLYFLTESFHRQKNLYNGKYSLADFITAKALHILQEKKRARLVFEHMVPKNIYLNPLVQQANQGTLTYTNIYDTLTKYYYTCTVTKEEDNLLPATKMPHGWDGQDPFYRYQLVGLHFIENPKVF